MICSTAAVALAARGEIGRPLGIFKEYLWYLETIND